MNPLKALHGHGQSIWLDYISRGLITTGGLKRLVEEDGLRGVTSNPTIFHQSISGSADYDGAVRHALETAPGITTQALYELLAIEDIQAAADILRPVYDASDGADGLVSLEVSPHLAHNTQGTVAEARRLWQTVGRPNLMLKVPATSEGAPAIETLIAEGVNVNVTLVFSLAHYEAIAHAYIRGVARHPDPRRVASVASFFVSRVDTAVDKALGAIDIPEALALRGKVAVANAKMGYHRFREIFYGKPFEAQRKRGGRVQRVLWGSTGTKDPAYSDVLYVEELIGQDTVNTVPPATLNAFRDHGRVWPTLSTGLDEAKETLARLAALGVDLDAVTEQLQRDGVAAFASSFDQLLASLDEKRRALQVGALAPSRPA
ncbi:MAG: transaldolase [Chloroflexi bacterium]|nr:transaldolase [Chloroflexota bacterium]